MPPPSSLTSTPAYVQDIRLQPTAVDALLTAGLAADVKRVLSSMRQFDRIVMTGMGASLFGQYPTYLRLAEAGLPIWSVETAELLGQAGGLVTANSLLWVVSQSGATAEVIALLERLRPRPGAILATTNDPESPLATAADAVMQLHCGPEHAVGTRSYVNTLAALSMAASHAFGEPPDADLTTVPQRLDDYLSRWDERLGELDRLVPESLIYVLGRGASLAGAMTGGLIIKEAAGRPVEGMSVPQFRHGPLEMTGPHVTVVLLAGDPSHRQLNRDMERDLRAFGTNVVWTDTDEGSPGCPMPNLAGVRVRPIAEILPLQLLSVVLAERAGAEPGAFRKIGKITQRL